MTKDLNINSRHISSTQRTTALTLDVSDLIGIPYKINGRSKAGYDCYGLAIEVERRLGKKLLDILEIDNSLLCQEFYSTLNVKKTDIIIIGTLIETRLNGELHIGVALDNERFIHATYNQGVRISCIRYYPVIGLYEVN